MSSPHQEEIQVENQQSEDKNLVLTMLLKSVREFEDTLYYKKYNSQEDKYKLEQILGDLKRQLAEQTQTNRDLTVT